MPVTKTYDVPGMHCAHCKSAVANELRAVAGVQDVVVDLETKRVAVTGIDLDHASLRAAIEEAGYDSDEVPA